MLTKLGAVVFHRAGHSLKANALFPGPFVSKPGQLPPVSVFDISEHYFPHGLAPPNCSRSITFLIRFTLAL